MPVFHCPLCPLIFEHRTEVEYHLRTEHRSRAEEEAGLVADLAAASRELDWQRLRALQGSRAGIAVTILMATSRSPFMLGLDVARLRRLAHQARRRLAAEPGPVSASLEHRVARAVAAAEGAPTQEGLAVLVNERELAIFHLPFEPSDRVVVDPSFATRDLEVTLQCYPRYRLVALGRHPSVFEGRGLQLTEVDHHDSVQDDTGDGLARSWGGKRSTRPERWSLGRERRIAGVHLADELLVACDRSTGALPLVIAGDGRWRSQFRHQSRYAPRVIAEIPGIRTNQSASVLARLAQPHLAGHVQEEQAAAMAELERADSAEAVVWGVRAAWSAVHQGAVDRLWVEQGYARPGRTIADDVAAVELVSDPQQPGVIDDVVDDLVEAAIKQRVNIHLIADGTINRPEPVAARLRTGSRAIAPSLVSAHSS